MKIESIELQSKQVIKLSRFTVIIGGNGVGKSTLLREISHEVFDKYYRGGGRAYRWLSKVTVIQDAKKDAKLLMESLDPVPARSAYRSRGLLSWGGMEDPNQGRGAIDPNSFTAFKHLAEGVFSEWTEIPAQFSYPFFSYHGVGNRLQVTSERATTDLAAPAVDALNIIWRNQKYFESLSTKVKEEFDRHLVLLDHRYTVIELGTADSPYKETALPGESRIERYSRIQKWKVDHDYNPVSEAGDGIVSMMSLMLSLLEPVNQVILIDEPELHLYPVQKRNIARYLGEMARLEQKQVIVVTHDSDFLQGVLDSVPEATIIRLRFEGDKKQRAAENCGIDRSSPIGATTSQREYLSALFHETAVIVEGATDRMFYQSVAEQGGLLERRDVGFVVASGKGGAVRAGALCHRVKVPYRFVFDFDIMLPSELEVLRGDPRVSNESTFSDVAAVSKSAFSEVLAALPTDTKDPNRRATRELKERGLGATGLTQETVSRMTGCLLWLAQMGTFVVPTGELESWVPEVEGKARFAEKALEYLRANPERDAEVRAFLRQVVTFH